MIKKEGVKWCECFAGRREELLIVLPRAPPHFWYINTATCLDRARLPRTPSLPSDLSLLSSFTSTHPTSTQHKTCSSICRYHLQFNSTPITVNFEIDQTHFQPTQQPQPNLIMPPKKTETATKVKAAPSHPTYQVCRVYSGHVALASATNKMQDMISDAIVNVCTPSPHLPAHARVSWRMLVVAPRCTTQLHSPHHVMDIRRSSMLFYELC